MAFEAITAVQAAEERAAAMKLQAEQAAAEAVERAERAGKAAVEAALAKADGELKTLRTQSDEKARGDAQDLASTTKNREAALKNRARTRLDHAASLIVERIVNS